MLTIALALAAPAGALGAGSATCQAYNPQLCGQISQQTGTHSSGGLPFTGLDLGLLAAGGALLVGTGMLVRRLVPGGAETPLEPGE